MQKPTLFYIYDALCGWCFGFAPVMQKLHAGFQNQFNFEVVNGGMITGERVGPIREMATYIKRSVPSVEQVSGVKFGEPYVNGILTSETYVSNSLPPAIALKILQEQASDQQIHLAHEIQQLHYVQGHDLNEVETYFPLCREIGLPEDVFRLKFQQKKYREQAQSDFELAKNWVITGFPAIVVEHEEKLYLLTQGFQEYEPLAEVLRKILSGEIKQDD
ncbi:DsbA family protein [Adhaeribacter sp. BT258]|uniref:DsbA family protein n=1 Tax=Adhaeribacter terrigena TaxID=2793070 RepID=A0ABS1C6N8_9BACT|nr:DsbA family protein [Adhaeribacter terrigena]MBK0404358.1 DsbA family protein [Adhaeribacter terrigena]